jgi:hypothetical protein
LTASQVLSKFIRENYKKLAIEQSLKYGNSFSRLKVTDLTESKRNWDIFFLTKTLSLAFHEIFSELSQFGSTNKEVQ